MRRPLAALWVCLLALLLPQIAWAQFPQGAQSGATPESSSALVTLSIPAVVGVNIGSNFVLDLFSATKCWGSSGSGSFPPAAAGLTVYTFGVSATSIPSTSNVACPAAGALPDLAAVQILSTLAASSRLQASILDGGQGAQATKFTDLIPDIFTANRLKLSIPAGDSCGGGTKFGGGPSLNLQTTPGDEVTAIPKTGWSNCEQTLSLTLTGITPFSGGIATGTVTFTMVSP